MNLTISPISEFVTVMVATNELETELLALAEMRLRWRHEPTMVVMIDKAIGLMNELAEAHDSGKLERLEAKSLALSKMMRAAFANIAAISIH